MSDLTPKGFSNGQYVDRFRLRDKLYQEDAITMGGVAILNNFPAADVVAVVRCCECVYHDDESQYHYCRKWRRNCPNDSDFFCKWGKRKNGGQDK